VSDDGGPTVNAEFFVLAFTAAFNPKLLGADLLLIENRRPRAMFLCVLLGGMTVALTIGLLDVLVWHADAISSQKTVSAGVDLALGLLLLAVGALLATGRLHGRRKVPVPAGDGPGQPEKAKKDSWAARVLAEPRLGLAMLVGALIGLPGAAYLTALHNLITGKYSTATQIAAVVIFVVIEFSLIIIPFTFLELRPEATKAALKNTQAWLLGHARQLMAYTALILGAYLAISALIRLA
jgi:Sap, sulfolipid-1-addressing protein